MLIEVRRELVRQDHRYLQKRFLQDAHNRIAIYIWQLPQDDDREMLRFQVTYRDMALDWAAERGLRFASVDDGDNPMGMKRTPILNAENSVSKQAVERLCQYLSEHPEKPALQFIREIIQKEILQGSK
jgi:hypothetical protein